MRAATKLQPLFWRVVVPKLVNSQLHKLPTSGVYTHIRLVSAEQNRWILNRRRVRSACSANIARTEWKYVVAGGGGALVGAGGRRGGRGDGQGAGRGVRRAAAARAHLRAPRLRALQGETRHFRRMHTTLT